MPTNDERREVAARLRDMAPGSDWPNYVAEACGMDVSKMSNNFHTFTEQLCQRIADLIEPEERTCRNIANKTDREFGNPFICSECGADPHDAESYHCGFSSGEYDWRFCPNCGAKVVGE